MHHYRTVVSRAWNRRSRPSQTLEMSCVDGSRIARGDVTFGGVVGCSLVFDLFARRLGRWP